VLKVLWRPVFARALMTFVAIGLPVAIIFSPQGLEARDLVRGMRESLALRLAVWLGWLLLAAPATAIVFKAPGSLMLRTLVSKRRALVPLLLLCAVVELPWAVLFLRGAGVWSALAAVSTAMAIEAAVVARRTSLVAVGLIAALAKQEWIGILLVGFAVRSAWIRAPELEDRAWMWIRSSSAVGMFNLVLAHGLRIGRRERARLMFGAMLMSLGGAGLMTLRNEGAWGRARAVIALPAVLVAALFVGPLMESEKQMSTMLRSLRVRRALVVTAFLIALATPATALAATAASVCGPPALPAVTSWTAMLSVAVGLWGRRYERTTFAIGVVALGVIAVGVGLL